jgi:hypothetical protein
MVEAEMYSFSLTAMPPLMLSRCLTSLILIISLQWEIFSRVISVRNLILTPRTAISIEVCLTGSNPTIIEGPAELTQMSIPFFVPASVFTMTLVVPPPL